MPRYHLFFIATISYLVYYLVEVVKRPILAVKPGIFKNYLIKNVPILNQQFYPTIWCVESRVQTVFASFVRASIMPPIDYEREVLQLSDGGEVALDWLTKGCDMNAPIIIILPGLTGESQAEYIKFLVTAANEKGIKCCVFNNRGLGGIQLKTPRLYCAANCEDLSEVMKHVHKKFPDCIKGAAGVSMGGLILGNYLSEHQNEAAEILTAAKLISVPWDVEKGTKSIEKPFLNMTLNRHLCYSLCRTVEKYDILFKDSSTWREKVLSSQTIKEFDSNFTSVHFGFESVDTYYSKATLHQKLHKIKVPTLCLSAADDPFQPLDAIPIKAAEESSHCCIVVTARGGHIGFLDGIWPNKDQYMSRLFAQYFSAVLFDKENEFIEVVKMLDNSDF
ncbi:hypothetical protein PVAND_006621 [Polypedilum vanderplanki]|uniref:Serine aminopeptidase S33 domain-containing protein n=1 Tax=Polypedilum vanderplanki TaxID=319348 RepID=A0A9J6C4J2_POLVA|nr:hypothetical protein PVAND_006621 [Polypedilum vanderplanki]